MFLFMEDRHSIDVMNRPDANVIPQSWETQPVLQPSNLCAVEYKMKFFTEQWYYSGCPHVPEYEGYAKSIAEKLPDFFKSRLSLHDAVIRRIRIREDFWNHYELTLDLDSHSAYAKIKRLVFHGAHMQICDDLDGARWIAQEIFAEDHAYTLNVLLLYQDDALRELSISFDSMEALV